MNTGWLLGRLSRPETRTADQYRQEIQRHLADYADFLDEHPQWEYCQRNIGLLRLTLVNPTDRVFEAVQVEVYLPGQVDAMDPYKLSRPGSSAPSRLLPARPE